MKEVEYWDGLGFFNRMDFKSTHKSRLNLLNKTNIKPKTPKNTFVIPVGQAFVDLPFIAYTSREGLTTEHNFTEVKMPTGFMELEKLDKDFALVTNQIKSIAR